MTTKDSTKKNLFWGAFGEPYGSQEPKNRIFNANTGNIWGCWTIKKASKMGQNVLIFSGFSSERAGSEYLNFCQDNCPQFSLGKRTNVKSRELMLNLLGKVFLLRGGNQRQTNNIL
jgi:hypothetical protein